jgi:hypothetical protein
MNKVVLGALLSIGIGTASAPASAIYCDYCSGGYTTSCYTAQIFVGGVLTSSERFCSVFYDYSYGGDVPSDFPDFWDRNIAGGGGWRFTQKMVIPRMANNMNPATCHSPLTDRWMHADTEVTLYRATGVQVPGGVPVRISYDGGGSELWISGPWGSTVGVTGDPVPNSLINCP